MANKPLLGLALAVKLKPLCGSGAMANKPLPVLIQMAGYSKPPELFTDKLVGCW
jgi:hypothetical protein